MTQSMKDSVPTEILESARMDGCGELRLFFSFVISLSNPSFDFGTARLF